MKTSILVLSLFSFACATQQTPAVHQGAEPAAHEGKKHVHWSYSGPESPSQWAALSSEYRECAAGKNQSPINITHAISARLPAIEFHYDAGGYEIGDNGHTVQVDYKPGSSIVIDEVAFALKQFHFHAPSENHVEGHAYPLEAHLVHADKDGNLAVVAVLFEVGEANPALTAAWSHLPSKEGEMNDLPTPVDVSLLLPADKAYYRFSGSLTTPPCTEGVRWLVMENRMTASQEQVDAFTHLLHGANNRPIQPLNGRPIIAGE